MACQRVISFISQVVGGVREGWVMHVASIKCTEAGKLWRPADDTQCIQPACTTQTYLSWVYLGFMVYTSLHCAVVVNFTSSHQHLTSFQVVMRGKCVCSIGKHHVMHFSVKQDQVRKTSSRICFSCTYADHPHHVHRSCLM